MTQKAKKDFTAEAAGVFVDKMISPAAAAPTAEPQAAKKPRAIEHRTPQTNAAGTEIKATFMLREDLERKVRYIAYAERCKQKVIINDALQAYVDDYEATHGAIR